MKASIVFLTLTAFLVLCAAAKAQSDTAHHRTVFSQVNARLASLQMLTARHVDEPTEFALSGWLDGGEVKKIVARNGDDGEGVEEYYLENEKPLFVFSTYSKSKEDGSRGIKVEERLYFKDGSVFKWLTTQKPAPVLHGEDYQAATERLVANAAAFVAALKSGRQKTKTQMAEGIFVGIEEGDYFHWNMTSKSGQSLSFFILKGDDSVQKVIDTPKAYVGKKCRVIWKKSSQNIPEAGGKMEIEQILSVEWLEKK